MRIQDFENVQDDHHQDSAIAWSNAQKIGHPRWFTWRGQKIFQPPNPLKVFVRGVEDRNGMVYKISSYKEPEAQAPPRDNPLSVLSPSMDLVFFVGVIMSLLAVVFGYDAVAGEKERGTLRLMLTYPVPRDTVLLGKWVYST